LTPIPPVHGIGIAHSAPSAKLYIHSDTPFTIELKLKESFTIIQSKKLANNAKRICKVIPPNHHQTIFVNEIPSHQIVESFALSTVRQRIF
jgi:hypothetical protein